MGHPDRGSGLPPAKTIAYTADLIAFNGIMKQIAAGLYFSHFRRHFTGSYKVGINGVFACGTQTS